MPAYFRLTLDLVEMKNDLAVMLISFVRCAGRRLGVIGSGSAISRSLRRFGLPRSHLHLIFEKLERVESRVIVRLVDDSLDRPTIDVDRLGQRIQHLLVTLIAQPYTQAVKVIHESVSLEGVNDEPILRHVCLICKGKLD